MNQHEASITATAAPDPSQAHDSAPVEVSLSACLTGGHLMSWRVGGVERLWCSPMSRCGQAEAIRGGVPILFPQFGAFGPLSKHGFARNAQWHALPVASVPGAAVLAMRLHDSPETRAVWSHPFELTVQVQATATWLELSMAVRNRDDYTATFTCGLHNYFPVTGDATVTGLGGLQGWDAVVAPGKPEHLEEVPEVLAATAERDLIVRDVTGPVVLSDPVLGRLTLTATGFPNRVVWNPGPNHSLADVPAGGEGQFVCIEPAAITTPVELHGGQNWVGSQRLELAPLA